MESFFPLSILARNLASPRLSWPTEHACNCLALLRYMYLISVKTNDDDDDGAGLNAAVGKRKKKTEQKNFRSSVDMRWKRSVM